MLPWAGGLWGVALGTCVRAHRAHITRIVNTVAGERERARLCVEFMGDHKIAPHRAHAPSQPPVNSALNGRRHN